MLEFIKLSMNVVYLELGISDTELCKNTDFEKKLLLALNNVR